MFKNTPHKWELFMALPDNKPLLLEKLDRSLSPIMFGPSYRILNREEFSADMIANVLHTLPHNKALSPFSTIRSDYSRIKVIEHLAPESKKAVSAGIKKVCAKPRGVPH